MLFITCSAYEGPRWSLWVFYCTSRHGKSQCVHIPVGFRGPSPPPKKIDLTNAYASSADHGTLSSSLNVNYGMTVEYRSDIVFFF